MGRGGEHVKAKIAKIDLRISIGFCELPEHFPNGRYQLSNWIIVAFYSLSIGVYHTGAYFNIR
jgi:hypothetical protein